MKKLLLLFLLIGSFCGLKASIITVTESKPYLFSNDGTWEWAVAKAQPGDTIRFAIREGAFSESVLMIAKTTIDKSLFIDGGDEGISFEWGIEEEDGEEHEEQGAKLVFINNNPDIRIDVHVHNIAFKWLRCDKRDEAVVQVFGGVNLLFTNTMFGTFVGAMLSQEGASTVTLQDCEINNANFYEDGFVKNSKGVGEGRLNIINSRFVGNNGTNNGPLLNCVDTLSIVGSVFNSNNVKAVIENVSRKPLYISNTAIYENKVARLVVSKEGGSAVLTNVSIGKNNGAAIYNLEGALTVRNCIFSGNDGGIVYNNSEFDELIKVQNSLVQGLPAGNGNLDGSTDPLFETGVQPKDFFSPVLNKGNNDFVTGNTDAAGRRRIVQGTVDMGAYEIKGLLYVDSAVVASGNGYSWGQAYKTLDEAIANTDTTGQAIWVKKGTYKPSMYPLGCTTCKDTHDYAFTLQNGAKLYGSFAGTETSLGQRTAATMLANPTILSGDLNGDDLPGFVNTSDNASHVLMSAGNNDSTLLDGFAITGGDAANFNIRRIDGHEIHGDEGGGMYITDGSPTVQNCLLAGNRAWYGGGLFVKQSSPFISHVVVSDNKAFSWGGGVDIEFTSTPVLLNTTFARNNASSGGGINISQHSDVKIANVLMAKNTAYKGGGIRIYSESNAYIVSATIYGNAATYGGGIFNESKVKLKLYNSIIYANTSTYNNSPGIVNDDTEGEDYIPTIANSLVQGGTSTANGNLGGSTDPLFVSPTNPWGADGILGTADDGLQLQLCSPAVNAGSPFYRLSNVDEDIIGNDRIFGNTMDMGAYELQQSQSTLNLIAASGAVAAYLSPRQTIDFVKNCELLATVTSSGLLAISDSVTAKVWVDPSEPKYNGRPLAKRHFELLPKILAEMVTGRVKLYATQQEFDSYNQAVGALIYLPMPASATDQAATKNLRILGFSGASNNGSGLPDTYPADMIEIVPADSNIVWNSNQQRWEISVDVTGFGGFFIGTARDLGGLPVKLLSFAGQLENGKANLQWQTTGEENTSHFIIEKSTDGIHFSNIGKVISKGNGNHAYAFGDATPIYGIAYYRLTTVDKDGKTAYSNIINMRHHALGTVQLYPQPASNFVMLQASNMGLLNSKATLTDMQGRQLQEISISQLPFKLDLSHLPAGMYHIKLNDGQVLKMIKQ